MADYSQTVSNAVRCFGGGPASLWNASYAIWNAFNWGEGTVGFEHVVQKHFADQITPSDNLSKSTQRIVSGEVAISGEESSETVQDGAGYSYVYPSGITNLENRSQATWSDASEPSSSWTTATGGSTTWS